ncbi:unnamed protein product [Onchocerca ochengi]|uniref:ODV-E66 n=1 Tax=Onchocerca ochengi TaxID=42157 RepID=A0A182EQG4_ONCOC|nr:unnamed protein product [Onchocerca ochengi]
MLKPVINSADTMKVISTTMNDNNYICDNATGITQRITNDAQTQTINYFSHNETFNYSNKFIVILISILICLQLFTLLKISYISNIQCADSHTNSAFTKATLRHPNGCNINAINLIN